MRDSEQQLSWSSDSRSSHTPQTRLPPSQLKSETRVPAASTQPDVSDAAATRAPLHLQHARKQHLCDHNSRDNRVRESHQATTSLQAAVRSEPHPAPLDPPPRASNPIRRRRTQTHTHDRSAKRTRAGMRDTVGSAESGGNPPADAADIRRTVLIRYEPSTRSTYHERPNRYELKPLRAQTGEDRHPFTGSSVRSRQTARRTERKLRAQSVGRTRNRLDLKRSNPYETQRTQTVRRAMT